jgi:hypothetical protein
MNIQTSIVDLALCKEHERTLGNVEQELAEKIKKEGIFFRSITVDDKHHVILDGHHRYNVLTKILKDDNFTKIPAAKVPYFTDGITLEKWYRFIPSEKRIDINLIMSHTSVLETMTLENAPAREIVKEADRIIEKEKALGMMVDMSTFEASLLEARTDNVRVLYDDLEVIENSLRKMGCEVQYHKKEMNRIQDSNGYMLIGPKVEKDDVLTVGMSGELFAPKSTRHKIHYRIINDEIPLEQLK